MIEPYGGMLVNRVIDDHQAQEALNSNYQRLEISQDVLLEIENIAFGVYSPLTGFPAEQDYQEILYHWRLTDGRPFSMPPLCHIREQDFQKVEANQKILLSYNGEPVAIMEVVEKFIINKEYYIEQVFQTSNPNHPGVSFTHTISPYLLAGSIWKLGSTSRLFGPDAATPTQIRHLIKKRGWQTVTAFSTTNIPHRAHEYLHRIALDVSDGLLIHALGTVCSSPKFTKAEIIVCYQALIDTYLPGQNILFSFLPILPRSAGPRSTLLQAIIRQNFGCTHQIVGRDHDGANNCYGPYESQEIFDRFPEIGLRPLKIMEPYYCRTCDIIVTERNCRHSEEKISVSGTELREKIRMNESIPDFYMRDEVLQALKRSSSI